MRNQLHGETYLVIADPPATLADPRQSIRDHVLRAIVANRTPGYHFPGHLLDARWPEIGRERARLVLPLAPHIVDADGSLDLAALAVFADMALGMAARLDDAHHERQATLELQLHLTGVAAREDLSAIVSARDCASDGFDRYSLTEATIEAGGHPIACAIGKFVRLRAPDGVALAPLPWQREHVVMDAGVDERQLHPRERDILARCDTALARCGPSESFVRCLWAGECVRERSEATRRLRSGPHITNRVDHVHGGVQVALAATSAIDVVPPDMQVSSLSAWFLRPGVTDLVARSTIVHHGRQTMLVETRVSGSDDAQVLHAVTQFVVPGQGN
jgi:acyl-coenzyme A thioesterase PaaI-like protein